MVLPDLDVDMSREVSQFIANRYRLDLKIGTGGMGTVFKGYDLHLKRPVALKVIRADSLSNELSTRLHREAKAICRIEHDNIVKVFDFLLSQENEAVMIMELVSGRSLEQIIKRDGPYPLLPALDIFRQLCEAMSYAHKQGVLHRDLKPSNVLLTEARGSIPIVKVVDFGVAQVSNMQDQTLTQPGFLVGSPGYVSPEQARGQSVDERSDIYSLGCFMFFVLTGRPPFKGSNLLETVQKQINEPPPSLHETDPTREFGQQIESLVAKALAKNPADRYESMEHLRRDLSNIIYKALDENEPAPWADSDKPATHTSHHPHINVALLMRVLVLGFCIAWFACLIFIGRFIVSDSSKLPSITNYALFRFDLAKKDSAIPSDTTLVEPMVVEKDRIPWYYLGKHVGKQQLESLKNKDDVERLMLCDTDVKNEDLASLKGFQIEVLDLSRTGIGDEGLRVLAEIPSLKTLVLDGTRVTDTGIGYLACLPNLRILFLKGTQVTDAGVEKLSDSEILLGLSLAECKNITGKSAEYLGRMAQLLSLYINGSNIDHDQLAKLAKLRNLAYLNISNLGVTDGDVAAISKLNLNYLDMDDNPISDVGLKSLATMSSLQNLTIRGCYRVTASARRYIKRSIADLDVISNGDRSDGKSYEWYYYESDQYLHHKTLRAKSKDEIDEATRERILEVGEEMQF